MHASHVRAWIPKPVRPDCSNGEAHSWLHFAAQGAVLKQVEDLLAFEKGDPAREEKVVLKPKRILSP